MPRIATEQSLETIKARRALEAYLREPGRSQVALSLAADVPQPTISKFLAGRIKSITPAVRKVIEIANIGIKESGATLSSDLRIQRALGEAWDGTDTGTQLLASAIEALGHVLREASARNTQTGRS